MSYLVSIPLLQKTITYEFNTTSNEMWNKIKSIKGTNNRFSITGLEIEDRLATEQKDITNIIADTLEKTYSNTAYNQEFLKRWDTTEESPNTNPRN